MPGKVALPKTLPSTGTALPKTLPSTGAGQQDAIGNLTGVGALLAQVVGRSNPYVQGGLAALSIGGSLFDYFHTSEQEQQLQDILGGLNDRRTRLMGESRGDFSEGRQEQILQENRGTA